MKAFIYSFYTENSPATDTIIKMTIILKSQAQ